MRASLTRRRALQTVAAGTLLVGVPGRQCEALVPGQPTNLSWPSYLGPNGNFSESSDAKLLADFGQSRLVWQSEERAIGFGKSHSGVMKDSAKRYGDLAPGGVASLIVADGAVLAAYYVPSGDVHCQGAEEIAKQQQAPFPRHKWLLSADDVLLAIDANTGQTRWKQVFRDQGMNHPFGKRPTYGMTPVASEGRVYSVGTTGRVYALEIASGKVLWESHLGPRHIALEAQKKANLASKQLQASDLVSGLLVAGDVLLAPDGTGLVGIDTADGRRRWQLRDVLSGFNLPAPVEFEGRPHIVTVSRLGSLRLIDPAEGRVVWTHALGSAHLTHPVFTGTRLLVFDPLPGAPVGRSSVPDQGLLAAYELEKSGPRRVWQLADRPHELHLDGGPSRRVIPHAGLVWYLQWVNRPERSRRLLALREASGEIVAEKTVEHGQFYRWGDRVALVTDNQHEPTHPASWQAFDPDPARFELTGHPWKPYNHAPGRIGTCGYVFPIYDAFVDGRVYTRTGNGDVLCWDLRAS